jgi:tetratricopeptide (TPR) repeat protein
MTIDDLRMTIKNFTLLAVLFSILAPGHSAADSSDDVLKSIGRDNTHISNNDKELFKSSVQSAKSSIARDMLDTFYSDAVGYQSDKRYDEALETYEKILSIDPDYKDVASRRQAILKMRTDAQNATVRHSASDLIRKGENAQKSGLTLQAIAYWKQALEKDPANASAQKKINDANKAMARRQFEAGYIHYKHNELEDAIDSWENAIAFDPSLKNRGLLLLMSKVQLGLEREQVTRLANQGYDQMQSGDLPASLKTYEELLKIEPRHDEARKNTAKIKIQLGRQEYKQAQEAAAAKRWQEALDHYQNSVDYGWEVPKSQAGIASMKHQIELAKLPPPPPPKPKTKSKEKLAPPPEEGPAQGPPPATAVDPKAAKEHYRNGLAAVRSKDYQRAVEELQLAQQLDATDERIYMALERAKQEWRAASSAP